MHVCPNCFNDFELKTHIKTYSQSRGNCKFCRNTNTVLIEINELLDFFYEFFNLFKADAKGKPLIEIIEDDWELFKNNTIAKEILTSLFEQNIYHLKIYNEKVRYISEITDNVSYWNTFKEEIKWQQRFVLPIGNLNELGWDNFFNDKVEYKDDVKLYRARIQYNEGKPAFDCIEMGSPPKEKVSSGRANPEGIPYLYLSKAIQTTFYEVRALYKDEVSVGEFNINKGEYIYLVDFTEKASAFGGFIGTENLKRYTQKILLKHLISEDLSKPIRRYDSEIEYIPTQFICEFIKSTTEADGIIFNSSLYPDGQNVVIFNSKKVSCVSTHKYIINEFVVTAIEDTL